VRQCDFGDIILKGGESVSVVEEGEVVYSSALLCRAVLCCVIADRVRIFDLDLVDSRWLTVRSL